ncbi:hypothetical protein [Sphingomonas crusticola]|uniref:hypothetical protein n=1 Tax=Sphingomonas crusticola TaxID=1697973 RepID=UPI0013C2ECEA|nr:hypothetical protein [Sphingomonas crusticola]
MTSNPNDALRAFDDETLLDMYDHAHETGDAHCDAIAAELNARGIVVKPCGHAHAFRD